MKNKMVWAFLFLIMFLSSCKNAVTNKDKNIGNSTSLVSEEKTNMESSEVPAYTVNKEVADIINEALTYYYQKNYGKAISLCENAIQIDENAYDAYNLKGIALCYSGRLSEGVPLIEKSIAMNDKNAFAYHNMAMSYKIKGDYDKTLEWFYKALEIDENYTWSIYGAATIFADRKENDKALDWLERSIKLEPAIKKLAKGQHHWRGLLDNERFKELTKAD